MTQHRGYFCPTCGVRYVAHTCKFRLPCHHSKEDAFYTYQWDYLYGYKRFVVENRRHGILFDVRYVDHEKLQKAIKIYYMWLQWQTDQDNIWLFISDKTPVDVFRDACESAGGQGAQWPPAWRIEELNRGARRSRW